MKNSLAHRARSGHHILGLLSIPSPLFELFHRVANAFGWECVLLSRSGHIIGDIDLVIARPEWLGPLRDRLVPSAGLVAIGTGHRIDSADDAIEPDADDAAVAALLGRWQRQPFPVAAQRQVDTFGVEAIVPLLATLRVRLAAVLAEPAEKARDAAHQLAGLAGMLGFADVAHSWEAFSINGESKRLPARRVARLALATLDRADLSDRTD